MKRISTRQIVKHAKFPEVGKKAVFDFVEGLETVKILYYTVEFFAKNDCFYWIPCDGCQKSSETIFSFSEFNQLLRKMVKTEAETAVVYCCYSMNGYRYEDSHRLILKKRNGTWLVKANEQWRE